jgi:hypothetical protein
MSQAPISHLSSLISRRSQLSALHKQQIGGLPARASRRRLTSTAIEDTQAEQSIEVVLETGGDKGVPHLPEGMDGRLIRRGHWIGVDQLVLEVHVSPDKVASQRAAPVRALLVWNHSPPPGIRVAGWSAPRRHTE